jgi:hypothetical protein
MIAKAVGISAVAILAISGGCAMGNGKQKAGASNESPGPDRWSRPMPANQVEWAKLLEAGGRGNIPAALTLCRIYRDGGCGVAMDKAGALKWGKKGGGMELAGRSLLSQ